jgi:hypothetical protein
MRATIVQAAATPNTVTNQRVFTITKAATLRNMTIRHGNFSSTADGSAIRAAYGILTVDGCLIVSNNTAGSDYRSGTIHIPNDAGSGLVLINSEVRDNTATSGTAGVFSYRYPMMISNCVIAGNQSVGPGGGISADATGNAPVELYDTTIVSNYSATSGGGASLQGGLNMQRCTVAYNTAGQDGGGLSLGWDVPSRTVIVANVTICQNRALGNAGGGVVVYFYAGTNLTACFDNCTICSNSAAGEGGGIFASYGICALRSTVVAGNTASAGQGQDCDRYMGAFTDRHALVGDNTSVSAQLLAGATNANGSYVGTAAGPIDPRLGALADNGGPTHTCALRSDSPAVNGGLNALGLTTDQRGAPYARVVGVAADIGAFEFGAGPAGPKGTLILLR